MLLQGYIVSKEAKGFLVNFGLKDKSQGFLPLDLNSEHMQVGQIVQCLVTSVMASSKIIKCELPHTSLVSETDRVKVLNSKELSINNIKPAQLVTAKVSRILENGIELNFLGGYNGTVFIDHLDRKEPVKYKLGEKINARIVTVDPANQAITLSLLPHIVNFQNS